MTEKHTPGPWEFVPAGEWYVGSGCGVRAKTPEGPGFPTPNATGYYGMCCPPPHGRQNKTEQEANARLIAAAPEMLELIREVAKASGFAPEGVSYAPRDTARAILARIDND